MVLGPAAQSFLPAGDTPKNFSFSAASAVVLKAARAEATALAIATVLGVLTRYLLPFFDQQAYFRRLLCFIKI